MKIITMAGYVLDKPVESRNAEGFSHFTFLLGIEDFDIKGKCVNEIYHCVCSNPICQNFSNGTPVYLVGKLRTGLIENNKGKLSHIYQVIVYDLNILQLKNQTNGNNSIK